MTIEELKDAGGEEWQRDDKHVVVFNVQALSRLINLAVVRSETGRITGGSLDDRLLSNIAARKIYAALLAGKFFYDMKDKRFHYDPIMEDYAKIVIGVLRGKSAEHINPMDSSRQNVPELARRLRKNEPLLGLKSGKFTYVRDVMVDGPNDVAEIYRELKNADREKFIVMALTRNNRLLGTEVISMGSLNYNLVHPREVFKTPILLGAEKIICLHNHPSGTNEPSDEDLNLTKRLRKCGEIVGVELAYHVIVANNSWSAIHADGHIEKDRLCMTEDQGQMRVPDYEVYQKIVKTGTPILKPSDAVAAARAIFSKDVKSELVLMLNTRNEVLTIMDLNGVQSQDLWKRAICVNAAGMVICTGEKYETEKRSRLVKESKTFGIEILDIVEITGRDASGQLQQVSYKQNGILGESVARYVPSGEPEPSNLSDRKSLPSTELVPLRVWNQHLIRKTEGLPELRAQHIVSMTALTDKISEMAAIEPEVKQKIVSALNSPEGAKLIARNDEKTDMVIYAGLCLSEKGDPAVLERYDIPSDVKKRAALLGRCEVSAETRDSGL